MDALGRSVAAIAGAAPEADPDRAVRAFRAVDDYVLDAFRVTRSFGSGEGEWLAEQIRRTVARAGGHLVAGTAGGPGPRASAAIEDARAALAESRFYLYLARRLGVLDLRQYRMLAGRHDSALAETQRLGGPAGAPRAP